MKWFRRWRRRRVLGGGFAKLKAGSALKAGAAVAIDSDGAVIAVGGSEELRQEGAGEPATPS